MAMASKFTHEQYKKAFDEKFDGILELRDSKYISAREPIIAYCLVHGAFERGASALLRDDRSKHVWNRLQDELLELQSQLKRSIVFVSHDLDEAFKLGDQIAIMEGGRIVQQGAPKDIYTNPANEYVADFVAHMNPLGVLCARDLVEPSTTKPAIMVTADMDVREIMEQFGRGEEPVVGVMEGDQLIGQISTDRILAKLVDPRG